MPPAWYWWAQRGTRASRPRSLHRCRLGTSPGWLGHTGRDRCVRAHGSGGLGLVDAFGARDRSRASQYLQTACEPAPGRDRSRVYYKEQGDGRRVELHGTISETSLDRDPPRLKDMVRVHVTLSPPGYCYLIALNTNGKPELCLPAGGIVPSSPRGKVVFRAPVRLLRPDRRRGSPGVRGRGV